MLDFPVERDPQIMGIVNVTPDSFSDGGRFDAHASAIAQGRRLAAEGAHIVDVGGESTRPGAESIPVGNEIERVVPVVSALSDDGIAVSVDTSKPEVMEAAVAAGACMVNDIYALQRPGALEMAARLSVPVCLMHMQGTPATMQKAPRYDNLAREVTEFLRSRIDACVNAGIDRSHLLVDPGFGFGKTRKHNHTLMGQLRRFSELGVPLLIGVSRKAFVRALVQIDSEEILDEMSALLALLAVDQGAKFVRVHNARLTRDLLETHSVLEQTSL
ncbi:MAG: dihydropteroate synthase [Proteobacteria bacterium]|jgi:dihydropteroate synthase|nr:dihydropteroate synthase [Pseudomonadota bacterium]